MKEPWEDFEENGKINCIIINLFLNLLTNADDRCRDSLIAFFIYYKGGDSTEKVLLIFYLQHSNLAVCNIHEDMRQ